MVRPSEQFQEALERGEITPATDFWCYRQAIAIMELPRAARTLRFESIPPAYQALVKTYATKIYKKIK